MKTRLLPPMACDLIQSAFSVVERAGFSVAPVCPSCGGAVQGYDTRKKRFAILLEKGKERIVFVNVKRFICRDCRAICNADEPYYPGTRIGSPVIDLCVTLASIMPYSRASTVLETAGVVIDRTSCRKYGMMHLPRIPSVMVFGIPLPFSIISLATLGGRYGEGGPIPGEEILAACGFPSAYRAPADKPGRGLEQDELDDEDEKR